VYQPWYRHTPRYVRHVNVSNTIIVNNVTNIYGGRGQRPGYVNSAMARAVTAVNRDQFVGGRPVGTQRVHVDEGQLRQWRSNVRPSSIAPDRESILAGQPRREAPPRASFAQDNPKRASGGDFRAARVAAEEIRRAQSSARNIAPEKRVALREPGRNSQFEDRSVERSQNANREPERVQSMRGESERPARDHMERPPVQALQGSPSESQSNRSGSNEMIRRARESMDQRDVFRQDNSRPERQAPVERRESAAPRESVHRQSAPRDSAPVMRSQPRIEQSQPRVERSYSPPREVHSSPPPREVRSSPPPDNSSRQNSNQGSSRHSGGNDDGGSNRDRPNRRPD
jgi:hypothetical protein